ncbi:DUF368 domain-containing protein [Marinobacter sp.]|uniref:DUF368 domain-containing protein n=1 Tax=Marinobacter sp. TaxID=50741 RepID=UPI0025BF7D92|nr:DUF368 domain-containing protein [Marinobacter sp.]
MTRHSESVSETQQHHPAAIYCRGLAMGAADIVPGVSGGTIAFITGIYFRLLEAVNAVPRAVVQQLLRGRWKAFWEACDGTFLVLLLAGIVSSVVAFASAISYALANYPVLVWSFFFGLIVASVQHVAREIREPRWQQLIPFVTGVVFAWWISTLSAGQVAPERLAFFGAGAIAICAMILPGISGSFILVLLGMYAPVLDAVRSFDVIPVLLFMAGCVVGLLSVARLITWAFHRFHDLILVLLTGFMVGALAKVWPWKETLSWRTNSSGQQVPLNETVISPARYTDLTGEPSQWPLALLIALAGIAVVLVVEWLGARKQADR